MVLERPAFTSTRTEEERAADNSETITIKLNRDEREALESFKELADIGPDSAAIKLCYEIGRKVLLETFTERWVKYLVSLKRVRYDGRKRRSRSRNFPKVAQNDLRE